PQPLVSRTRVTHGVASGDVSDTSAVIWTRTDSDATVVIEYATSPAFSNTQIGGQVHVSGETDFTGTVTLTGLQPATRYYYRVRPHTAEVAESVTGTFVTAPAPDKAADVTFLWGGDLGGQGFCRQPEYSIFAPMKAQGADFFLFVGDTIYA